ncbi:MAG: DUF3783 domain-containing protein [Spirochaetes bacterium]|nr:DUF3783 domain-containing protein [Spirochaetota bacterium]MBU0953987.1 DUF3783 domain-containing protein [Spirochaetota bacterium]
MSDEQTNPNAADSAVSSKIVLFHGLSQQEVLVAMRAVKAALDNQKGIAFAMSTETNMQWKVSDLIEHVWEEHLQMTR